MPKIFKDQKKLIWTIIGGGNGGQAMAGHLGIMGFTVRIYDIFPETIQAINNQGGIKVEGVVNGFGKVELATTKIDEAINEADIVVVVAPSLAHKAIAKDCAPYLEDGQTVVLHPGSTFGALEFRNVLEEEKCKADIILAEANSLLYACRAKAPGHVNILGVKDSLMVAALPASNTENVLRILNTAFPQMYAGANVMEVSLCNLNAVVHPTPTLLNISQIESPNEWLYYWDGITPTIGEFVEELDRERIEIGKALGFNLVPVCEMYKELYGVDAPTLSKAVRNNKAYEGVKGQKSVETRYVLEDIPMGLVPMASLGKKLGIDVSRIETIIKLGEYILKRDFRKTGRTLENLGISEMSKDELLNYIETGIRGKVVLA